MKNTESKKILIFALVVLVIIFFYGKKIQNYLSNFSLEPEKIVEFRVPEETNSYWCSLFNNINYINNHFCLQRKINYLCRNKEDLKNLTNALKSREKTNFYKKYATSSCLTINSIDLDKHLKFKILHMEGKFVELEMVILPNDSFWTYAAWIKSSPNFSQTYTRVDYCPTVNDIQYTALKYRITEKQVLEKLKIKSSTYEYLCTKTFNGKNYYFINGDWHE